MFPQTYRMVDKYQHKYKELLDKLKFASYHANYFRGGRNIAQLIFRGDNFFVRKILQKCVVTWYHMYPMHPEMYRAETTISQHH